MAAIVYPYDPVTQDLWLYANETLVHSGGSTVVKKPVAWNPSSPLYGYRKSLQGISLRKRYPNTSFLTEVGGVPYAEVAAVNNPANPVNEPVFFNTYPMGVFAVSKRFCFVCRHCFALGVVPRNPNNFWSGGVFAEDNFLNKMMSFSWMDKNNVVTDSWPNTQVMAPFTSDANPSFVTATDLALVELPSALSFEPLQVVDARNLRPGSTVWFLDSYMKIIRSSVTSGFVHAGIDSYGRASKTPNGQIDATVYLYLHDSGSVMFAEISPPTSLEAGDGVLGLIPAHVFSAVGTIQGYGTFTSSTNFAAPTGPVPRISEYMADRGYPMRAPVPALRQHPSSDFAVCSVMDETLRQMNNLIEGLEP